MAFTPYHSITWTGSKVQHNGEDNHGLNIELIAPGEDAGNIKSIMIANIHATADATVSLYIQDDPLGASTSTFYIMSTVAIPSDTSLLLDNNSILSFDNSSNGYGLYLTVGGSDTLDVMINR